MPWPHCCGRKSLFFQEQRSISPRIHCERLVITVIMVIAVMATTMRTPMVIQLTTTRSEGSQEVHQVWCSSPTESANRPNLVQLLLHLVHLVQSASSVLLAKLYVRTWGKEIMLSSFSSTRSISSSFPGGTFNFIFIFIATFSVLLIFRWLLTSLRKVWAAFWAPTCNRYSYTYKANLKL